MSELSLISVVAFGSGPVNPEFRVVDQKVSITLTDGEAAEIRAICFRAFERHRDELAKAILTAQPALLEAPKDYAEFEEVTS